jgi:CHASE2 domain-containing sensor protein
VLQTSFWLLALQLDPFGLSTASDRASEDIFLRLYPIFYPATNQDEIKVVMIDERDLPLKPGGSREWPLEYNEYAALIEKVLEQKPRGVFIDLLFDTSQKRDITPLRELIDRIPKDGPPVVFATYASNPERILLPGSLTYEGGGAMKGVVELVTNRNHYQTATGLADHGASAATVLYNSTNPSGKRIATDEASQFLVTWGNTLPARDAADPACANIVDTFDSRLEAFASTLARGVSGSFPGWTGLKGERSWERMQPCPYHQEIPARDLMQMSNTQSGSQLEGKYVLIGAAVSGSGDTINSPVHGQLPGVYLHAVALDNLLTFGGKPLARGAWVDVLQGGLIFMCTFAGGLAFARSTGSTSPGSALLWLLARVAAWLLFACALALLLLLLLSAGIAPYNWGGVLAVGLAVFFAGAGSDLLALVPGQRGRT